MTSIAHVVCVIVYVSRISHEKRKHSDYVSSVCFLELSRSALLQVCANTLVVKWLFWYLVSEVPAAIRSFSCQQPCFSTKPYTSATPAAPALLLLQLFSGRAAPGEPSAARATNVPELFSILNAVFVIRDRVIQWLPNGVTLLHD